MRYAVVIEKGDGSFSAYVPDLQGCVAVAETEREVEVLIREAIEFHLEALAAEGTQIPVPQSRVDYVEVRPAA